MHFFQVFYRSLDCRVFSFLLTFLLYQQFTLASPVSETSLVKTPQALAKRYKGAPSGKIGAGGPDISDYPDDDEIRNAFIQANVPLVFFSQLEDSIPASDFAESIGGVICRGAYPESFTTKNGRSDQWYLDFCDRFSGIFSEKASGDVYVVSLWSGEIDACRVRSRIEYPSLQANKRVIWVPDDGPLSGGNKRSKTYNLQKRDGYCFDWDGYGEDPGDPDASSASDVSYSPGWCGIHVQQYQKNEPSINPGPDYRFDITIKDDQGETIGQLLFADAPGGQGVDVDSKLPDVMIVTVGNVDSDAILFAYGGQTWGSNDQPHQYNFGKFDSGTRNGDCGFTC